MVDDGTDEQVYERRLAIAHAEMTAAGIKRVHALPLGARLLRRLGRRPRPPYYTSFAGNTWFYGVLFGVIFTAFELALSDGDALGPAVAMAVCTATVFGLMMAWVVGSEARRVSLSSWEDLDAE